MLSRKCCTIRTRAPAYRGSLQFDTTAKGGKVGVAFAARGASGAITLADAITPKAAMGMAADLSRMAMRLRQEAVAAQKQKRGIFGRLLWWRRK